MHGELKHDVRVRLCDKEREEREKEERVSAHL